MKKDFIGFSAVAIACSLISAVPIQAQITGDKTLPINTVVNTQGTTFTITGGTQIGGNQFHSFQEFSVPTGNTAYFNNGADISNIISRVTGNSISNIDGLIKANGQANLFLINPNGIILGKNAQLQIGGSFTASTANSFKFPDGTEFSATNPQAPPLLTVTTPLGLQYGKDHNATIINDANLNSNKDLTLSSGSVVSNGTLFAQGNLLVESVTGDVEVKDAIANTATFSANRNLILNSSQIGTLGNLNLLAKDSVIARDSIDLQFIASAGDKLTVQGDRLVDLFILNNPNSGLFSGGDMVFRSANTIIGDAHYYANGNFRIEKLDGSIGNIESPIDPIIRSLGDVTFGVYLGRSLHIIAGGKVTIEAVQISGADTTNNSINNDKVLLSNGSSVDINGSLQPTLDIRAGVNPADIGTAGVTPNQSQVVTIGTDSNLFTNFSTQLKTSPTASPVAFTFNTARNRCTGGSASCFINSAITALAAIPNTSLSSPTESGIKIGKINIQRPDGVVLLTNNYKPNNSLTGNSDIEITGLGSSTLPIAGISLVPAGTTTSKVNGGSLYIDSRRNIIINPNTSILTSSTLTNANAGNITLLANNQINLGQNVQIKADGTNLGGQINLLSKGAISAQGLQLFSTSTTSSSTGNSGNINITAASLNLTNSNTFASQIVTSTVGNANAGNIVLNVSGAISLNGSLGSSTTEIRSQVFTSTAKGNSGNITINGLDSTKAVDSLSLTKGAQITANTEGIGNAGEIKIFAKLVSIDGVSAFDSSKSSSINSQILKFATGSGSRIFIDTDSLYLNNKAQISTTLDWGSLKISKGGNIVINSKILALTKESTINSSTSSPVYAGNAGDIKITTNQASFDSSFVSSSVNTNGIGNAGILDITARDISITNGAQLSSATSGKGNGGIITITADTLKIDGSGTFLGKNSASGIFGSVKAGADKDSNGGNINVIVAKNISLSNGARISASTDVNTQGKSGSILIDPEVVTLTNGSRISVSSLGLGDGGVIDLTAGQLSLSNSSIIAETANGRGGNITLRVRDLFWLRNASLVSATAGNNGDGGNINLSASFVLAFATENSDIIANAFKGRGGNITINTQGIFGLEYRPQLTPLSDITASSQFGVNGTVTINTPGVDPSKGLGKLPVDVTDSSKLLAQRCIADNADSKFFITGRGGLPPSPSDAIYRTTQILANVGSVNSNNESAQNLPVTQNHQLTSSTPSNPDRIVEIQGWVVDQSGKVSLISELPSSSPNWIWSNQPKCISSISRY